jgi:hypothetical protein
VTRTIAFATVAAGVRLPHPHGLCGVCRHFDPVFEGGLAGVCRNPNAALAGYSVGRAHGCVDHHPRNQKPKGEAA